MRTSRPRRLLSQVLTKSIFLCDRTVAAKPPVCRAAPPSLRVVEVDFGPEEVESRVARARQLSSQAEEIEVAQFARSNHDWVAMLHASPHPQLESLELTRNLEYELLDDSLADDLRIRSPSCYNAPALFPQLRTLYLSDTFLPAITPNLRFLEIVVHVSPLGALVTANSLSALLSSCKRLEYLELRRCIPDISAVFASFAFPYLNTLVLEGSTARCMALWSRLSIAPDASVSVLRLPI